MSPRVTGWNIATAIKHPGLEFGELFRVGRDVEGDAHRRSEGGASVERKTLPCPDEFYWPPAKIFAQVVEEEVKDAIASNYARQDISRVTGFGAANSTASTRAFHSRQRSSGGRSASSRSKSGPGLAFRGIVSKPVEAEGRATGEFARGAKRDQALEQPPPGAVAETCDGRRGGDRVVGEQRLERPSLPLGAQLWRGLRQPARAAVRSCARSRAASAARA